MRRLFKQKTTVANKNKQLLFAELERTKIVLVVEDVFVVSNFEEVSKDEIAEESDMPPNMYVALFKTEEGIVLVAAM